MTGPLPHPHRGDRPSEGPGDRRAPGCGPSLTAGVPAVRIPFEPTGTACRLARLVEMGPGAVSARVAAQVAEIGRPAADLAAQAEAVVAQARRAAAHWKDLAP